MLIAADAVGNRIVAAPGLRGFCITCTKHVLARCGNINIWHWAHEVDSECDPWAEHETPWHAAWKEQFPVESREVVIGSHRADIYHRGWVIEFQHSSISTDEIMTREDFYGKMIWIVDAEEFFSHIESRSYDNHYITFNWKWPQHCWRWAKAPLIFDIGGPEIFRVLGLRNNKGWGRFGMKAPFVQWIKTGEVPPTDIKPLRISVEKSGEDFVARCPYEQRHILKVAGFQWDKEGRRWYTRDLQIAAQFEPFRGPSSIVSSTLFKGRLHGQSA